MLQYLRNRRVPISRMLLTLLSVLWLGVIVHTCALADTQDVRPDHTGDCCCEEGADRCAWEYAPLGDAPCPAMQALVSERHPPGLIAGEMPPPLVAPLPDLIEYPPPARRGLYPSTSLADSPDSHPALRFRVLLI